MADTLTLVGGTGTFAVARNTMVLTGHQVG